MKLSLLALTLTASQAVTLMDVHNESGLSNPYQRHAGYTGDRNSYAQTQWNEIYHAPLWPGHSNSNDMPESRIPAYHADREPYAKREYGVEAKVTPKVEEEKKEAPALMQVSDPHNPDFAVRGGDNGNMASLGQTSDPHNPDFAVHGESNGDFASLGQLRPDFNGADMPYARHPAYTGDNRPTYDTTQSLAELRPATNSADLPYARHPAYTGDNRPGVEYSNLAQGDDFKTRKSEHKDWPNHRTHFENNYKNWDTKSKARNTERVHHMNNWKSNKY